MISSRAVTCLPTVTRTLTEKFSVSEHKRRTPPGPDDDWW